MKSLRERIVANGYANGYAAVLIAFQLVEPRDDWERKCHERKHLYDALEQGIYAECDSLIGYYRGREPWYTGISEESFEDLAQAWIAAQSRGINDAIHALGWTELR